MRDGACGLHAKTFFPLPQELPPTSIRLFMGDPAPLGVEELLNGTIHEETEGVKNY